MEELLEEFNYLDFCSKEEADTLLDHFGNSFFQRHYDPSKLDYFLCVEKELIDDENNISQTAESLKINISYMDWFMKGDLDAGIEWYCKYYDIQFIDRLAYYFVRKDFSNPVRKYEIACLRKVAKDKYKYMKAIEEARKERYRKSVREQQKKLKIKKGEVILKFI